MGGGNDEGNEGGANAQENQGGATGGGEQAATQDGKAIRTTTTQTQNRGVRLCSLHLHFFFLLVP